MKQKIANRPNWTRILKKRYDQQYINDEVFEGYMSCLYLDQVREPLSVQYADDNVCIVDHGYSWIMLFPRDSHHSVTIMLDSKDQVLQWYFDMTWLTELNDEGVPVIHDLYLDLVQLPNGNHYVLDEEELLEALHEGVINEETYEIAVQEIEVLKQSLEKGDNKYILNTEKYIKLLRKHRSNEDTCT
ncbi:DUF402 domain-containing protein [Paenibacillus sp. UNC451MF]|uniref:DUF402 domain-containing protein n=1 Tax=Paenibacillus sp. UNC451MF TaxID=1449063 RepID=UPI00068BDF9B|nr:DUF402 domain-containing protein [Paenibacillus sp. UNC451MF]